MVRFGIRGSYPLVPNIEQKIRGVECREGREKEKKKERGRGEKGKITRPRGNESHMALSRHGECAYVVSRKENHAAVAVGWVFAGGGKFGQPSVKYRAG